VSFGSVVKRESRPPEAHVGYLVTIIIVVVVGTVLVAAKFVSHELHPEPMPSRVFRRRAARRVTPGDDCVCGGTIGRTGRTSKRFGELLGCTACPRRWTMDGRRIIIRRRRPAGAASAADAASADEPDAAGSAVS
jgi:hypothetical protein